MGCFIACMIGVVWGVWMTRKDATERAEQAEKDLRKLEWQHKNLQEMTKMALENQERIIKRERFVNCQLMKQIEELRGDADSES